MSRLLLVAAASCFQEQVLLTCRCPGQLTPSASDKHLATAHCGVLATDACRLPTFSVALPAWLGSHRWRHFCDGGKLSAATATSVLCLDRHCQGQLSASTATSLLFLASIHVYLNCCREVQATLLQCLEALCQYSDQVVSHHKAVLTHLLPALAAAVARPRESRDTRFLCLKLLCDVILHFLLETDLYSAPSQQQQDSTAGQCFLCGSVLRNHQKASVQEVPVQQCCMLRSCHMLQQTPADKGSTVKDNPAGADQCGAASRPSRTSCSQAQRSQARSSLPLIMLLTRVLSGFPTQGEAYLLPT